MTDSVEQNKAIAFIRSRLTAVLGAGRDVTKAVLSLGPLVAVASDLLPAALREPPLPEVNGRVVSAADAAGVTEFVASMSALAIGAMNTTRSGATTAPSSTPLLSGATIDTAAFLERAAAVRALAAALWRLDGSIPRDATLEGPLTYCFAEDGAMPTVGAAPSKSISPASRLHSANVRITLKALAVAGPDIAIDGAFAALWSVQPAPAEDCPPKGRLLPVGYKVDRAPAHVAALAPVPFPTAVSLVLDGCIALHCDDDATDTSLSLGVATSLIVELCQRSVLACRLVQHWILALIKEPVALLAEATSSLPTSPHLREGIDRCVALAAQVLSQFGFEFPWARVANFATSAAASKWPLQRSMLLDLVERVSCLTFDERLRATVAASIAAASPPSFVSLAALRTSTPSIDDHRCIFALPPAFENAAGEYRRLLGSVCGIVPETQRGPAAPTAAVAAGPIPAMAIKRLLLSHRTASLSTRTAGRFIPAPARQLEAADEQLACMLYFVATPPIRSARVASARSLIATLGEDADALQRDDLWITTAHELLQQLRRLEASDAQPNGAISVGVRWLWDAIVVLADEHFLRARALGSFFTLDLLSPILGTLQLRTCVTEACDLYLNRLLRARVAASTPAEASATRLKFATLEASAFFDALTAALGPAVVESLKLLIANKSVVQAVSTLATASAAGRKALSGLLRFSDVFSDDASLRVSEVEALVKELGDPAWAREVLLLWTHRDVSHVPVPHDAGALLVVAPVHTGLALRRDAEEAVTAANVEMASAR